MPEVSVRLGGSTKKVERMRAHTFRMSDAEWAGVIAACTTNNEDASAVIRDLLNQYVDATNAAQGAE